MPVERLATRVFEDQYCPISFANECQRPGGPLALQMVLQSVLMGKAIDTGQPRAFRGQP